MSLRRCPGCSSERLESGSVVGAAIQLDRASTMKKLLASPQMSATVCLDCGAVFDLRADPKTLTALVE